MFLTSLALVISLQASGETPVAVVNDNPETWSVEYPHVIRPYVTDYRQCLNIANRRVTGAADFEAQHRLDLPRCEEARETAMVKSIDAMENSKARISASEVEALFENIGQIHISRGRDLDSQFRARIVASEAAAKQYDQTKPKGLVIEMADGSVVQSRADSIAAQSSSPASSGIE